MAPTHHDPTNPRSAADTGRFSPYRVSVEPARATCPARPGTPLADVAGVALAIVVLLGLDRWRDVIEAVGVMVLGVGLRR